MKKKNATQVIDNKADIVIPTKNILLVGLVVIALISTALLTDYFNKTQKINNEQIIEEKAAQVEEKKDDSKQKILEAFAQLPQRTNYDFAMFDSLHGRLYSYYVETLENDYFVQDASNYVDSYFSNNKYYKVYNNLPKVDRQLISSFLLKNFKDTVIDLQNTKTLETGGSQRDRLLQVGDNPYYADLLSLNYMNGWPQTHDDTYMLVRETSHPSGYCDVTDTDKITRYFINKSSSNPTCRFQFWVFDVNYEFTTYAEWTADRLLFANYHSDEQSLQEKTDTLNKLKKEKHEEVLDESGEFSNAEEAQAFLKKYLHVQSALPKSWKYTYISGEFPLLELSSNGIVIRVMPSLERGDMCGFDVNEKQSYECNTKVFLATKYFTFTEYISKGKTKEIIGSISSPHQITIIVGVTDEDGFFDASEKATITGILKSLSYTK